MSTDEEWKAHLIRIAISELTFAAQHIKMIQKHDRSFDANLNHAISCLDSAEAYLKKTQGD